MTNLALKDFTPRLYQETIFAAAINHNVLTVLPTGIGKTALAMMLASYRMHQYPNSKVLILTPTRPLCQQHYDTLIKHLDIDQNQIVFFTGHIKPEKREELWKSARVIISTPQGLTNDIISGKIKLADVSLMVFDECHRATGDYDYVWLAKQYDKTASHPRILGLTASPGSDLEKIAEICKNLYIEEIEVRTEDDPDVKPYIQDVEIKWLKVDLPDEFLQIRKFLDECFRSKLQEMKKLGYLNSAQIQHASKTELLGVQANLHGQIAQGDRTLELMKSVSLAAEAMKVQHALELVETQGIQQLLAYLERIESESLTSKVKAVQNLVRDINFRSALIKTRTLSEKNIEHPKLYLLKRLIKQEIDEKKEVKIIIFTQYRDTAVKIKQILDELELYGITSKIFVGQQKKRETGLSQKEQSLMLSQFRNSEFNVIIMTSVGEEGLDIPQVDLVVFYEPVPSAIRTIQRKGRTGRQDSGRVIILMTKNTRDEAYRWSAHHKELRMYRTLTDLKKKLKLTRAQQHTLADKNEDDSTIHNIHHNSHSRVYDLRSPSPIKNNSLSAYSSNADTINHNNNVVILLSPQTSQIEAIASKSESETPIVTLANLSSTNNVAITDNAILSPPDKIQVTELKVYVDYREKANPVVKELLELGMNVKLETLSSGDYLVSGKAAIEFKKTEDFVNSIIDGRLLQQIKSMKEAYEKPLLIVEGEQDIYSVRNIHPNAIRGMLATIAVSYGIPILQTKNFKETASLIYFIAKREQEESIGDFSNHANRKPSTLAEQQEYFISSLPNLGLNIAKDLLKEFKTVKNIVNATSEELQKVDNLGEKKAAKLKDVFEREYEA